MSARGPLRSFAVRVLGPDLGSMREAEREWSLAEVPQSPGMDRDAVARAAALAWWTGTGQTAKRSVVLLFAGEHFGQRVRFMRCVVVGERSAKVRAMFKEEAAEYVRAAEGEGGEAEPSLSARTRTSLPPVAGERADTDRRRDAAGAESGV